MRPDPFENEQFYHCASLATTPRKTVLVGWGAREWLTAPLAESASPFFFFPDYFLQDKRPWCRHEHAIELALDELPLSFLEASRVKPSPRCWQFPSFEAWEQVLREALSLIASGHLTKILPYLFVRSNETLSSIEKARAMAHGLKRVRDCSSLFLYGFWEGATGMLGVTPEPLFLIDRERPTTLVTGACAGTLPWRHSSQEKRVQFVEDAKEQREHRLVSWYLNEQLSGLGKVRIGKQKLVESSGLLHLYTPLKVELKSDYGYSYLVEQLHPTPAVGGYPRARGWEWLLAYANREPRGRYGAPVGYAWGEERSCYVAIRNIQWDQHHVQMGAGCGIVAESEPQREWKEMQAKWYSIFESLALPLPAYYRETSFLDGYTTAGSAS